MGVFSWILFGLAAGAAARWIMPGKDPGGWIVTTIIGIVGGMLGAFLGELLDLGTVSGLNLGSLVLGIIGALLVLYVYRRLAGAR